MVIASLNANSLLLHIDEIHTIINDLGDQTLAINKIKLDGEIPDDLVWISGFPIIRFNYIMLYHIHSTISPQPHSSPMT